MQVTVLGNMNNYPAQVARHFSANGDKAFLVLDSKKMLHRPGSTRSWMP